VLKVSFEGENKPTAQARDFAAGVRVPDDLRQRPVAVATARVSGERELLQ
jgi:hypothetical protein